MSTLDVPRISIVTPCLNSESTLERTMASVWSQAYPNLQHVIVDGGSTDGTLSILGRYPGAEVVSEPDDGLGDALNKGLRRTSGNIIGWLNADDLYEPGALLRVARLFQETERAVWLSGSCKIIDADDSEIRSGVTLYKSALLRRYSYSSLLFNNYICAPSTFFTRTAYERIGEFDTQYKYAMDYDFWLRVGRLGPPIRELAPLAAFRMAPGTLSMSGFETQFDEHATIARRHAHGSERIFSEANALFSRLIVAIYHAMAWRSRSR